MSHPESKVIKSISLHCQEGSSDKVYNISIGQVGDLYKVNAANGRRGSTLVHREKTNGLVSLEKANEVFDDLVKEKQKGGYQVVGGDVASVQIIDAAERFPFRVQLLTVAKSDDVDSMINSDDWVMQEKFDGERRPFSINQDSVIAGNKRSTVVPVEIPLANNVKKLAEIMDPESGLLDFDAEHIGDQIRIFDILKVGNRDLRNEPYETRLNFMQQLQDAISSLHTAHHNFPAGIEVVYTARTIPEKRALFVKIGERGEGVVFKHKDSVYSNSSIKFKFYEEASVIVLAQNEKNSVKIGLMDGQSLIEVGNVTIPETRRMPQPGEVIEVRYLYAYEGGSLYQPTYKHVRTDVIKDECVISQLKFKNTEVTSESNSIRPKF